MAVYKRGYQRYQGELTSHAARLMVMPRFAWERLFKQRLVVILLAVSLIWPLLCGAFIYVANHADLLKSFGGEIPKLFSINGKFFLVFMNTQSVFAVLLAALAGPGLIAPDLANNALPLYFSRPLSRTDYVVSRLAVLVGMLSFVTWVPGLVLFCMQVGMAGWTWLSINWYLGAGVFIGFATWILIVSMVALASSAYVKWRIIAGALVLGFFFILAGVAEMVNKVLRVDWGTLFNPARSIYHLWCALLGVDAPDGPGPLACGVTLAMLIVFLVLVLERKLRPVEVVS
jgi:ABC-2 type transport system permease protein